MTHTLKLALAALLIALGPQAATAQSANDYPNRPIRFIAPIPAGGSTDVLTRDIARRLQERWGQPTVVENKPGSTGSIGAALVARAPADGYTLLLVATPHAVNVTLYEKQEVNVLRDIVPVASIDDDAFAMVVNPSHPAKTVAEFIAHAKANPGKINVGSSGTGNLSHLAGELFKMMTGIEIVHVPYRGMPAANTALMTGESHLLINALPSVLPLIKEGRLRALAVTTEKRTKFLPDVPAVAETVPGYAVTGWLGIGAPKGVPPEVVTRLNTEMNAVLSDPEVLQRLANLGSEPFSGSPADFGRFIAAETEKWAKVVKFAGIKVN